MPVFIGKYNEIRESQAKEFEDEQGAEEGQNLLLGTIKVPKNLRLLSERLPKSNYGGSKPKKESKHGINKSLSSVNDQLASIQEEENLYTSE
jgi:hypothetical protein